MTTWLIYNAIDGTDLGEYEASSRTEALRMFLADTDDDELAPGVTAEPSREENRAGRRLSASQLKALWKFSQIGGSGYGEFSYLPRPTATSLAKLGYVQLGWVRRPRSSSRDLLMPWGVATQAGRDALMAAEPMSVVRPVDAEHAFPYGWEPAPPDYSPVRRR